MLIADNETEIDFLNYEAISRTVVELLNSNHQQALTVGIHGDWGAGKSSILRMVELEASKNKKIACLWFNGWTFQGFDDAKTTLIEATISELSKQRKNSVKVKKLVGRLRNCVNWMKQTKHLGTLALSFATGVPYFGGIAKTSNPDEHADVTEQIHQFREDFIKLLEESKIDRLLILLDDLDRCLPPTVIDTLEAIRLLLFVPHTAFVIAADETMIEYSVRQHFPELPEGSGPMPYARNYLEKLIQVPFRIPSLGTQETKTYVTLLLIESLVGTAEHEGFKELLRRAKKVLNQPWLGTGLKQSDIEAVKPEQKAEIIETYLVAQQIGPILAEGTKGNPRQIKRFLNSLIIRKKIADARGFGDSINQAVMAKLMLAERFQPDFYEHIGKLAMVAEDGKVAMLGSLENKIVGEKKPGTGEKNGKDSDKDGVVSSLDKDIDKWLERDWLKRWLAIEPILNKFDLRPYVFVARDRRMFDGTSEPNELIGKLCGSKIAVRSVETEVKVLPESDANQLFEALKERVMRQGSFNTQPSGFHGISIVAKHHPRFQAELLSMLDKIEVNKLGIWVVRGWNEILTEPATIRQLEKMLSRWAKQDENKLLKNAAKQALLVLTNGET